MNRMRGLLVGLLCSAVLSLAFAGAADAPQAPAGWRSGVGASSLADPAAAGEEAAGQAKRALGGGAAKFVMVVAAGPQLTPGLVEGVKRHFPAEIIYGGQSTSPLSVHGNHPDVASLDIDAGVAVWALGGDVDVEAAHVATNTDSDDAYYEAGVELAEALRGAVEANERPGRLIFTWGDQFNGPNKDFASGLNDGFEEVWPIIGAASGNNAGKEIIKGEIVSGVNAAVLIAGNFSLGMAMNGGTHTPETADKTLAEAISQGEGKEPFFALVFNCRRRRQGMMERGQLAEELDAIKNRLSGVDFFGFYGPGEIGTTKFGTASIGNGFTVVAAVFFANE